LAVRASNIRDVVFFRDADGPALDIRGKIIEGVLVRVF